MCHKTNKAQEWVRVWNVQTRKGRGSLDALWEKKSESQIQKEDCSQLILAPKSKEEHQKE